MLFFIHDAICLISPRLVIVLTLESPSVTTSRCSLLFMIVGFQMIDRFNNETLN